MGMRNGPNELLHSLSELRPGDAKRRFRKSIFEDFPLRGPLGQAACAYCGKWHEKLTLDHIVPKSRGGAHFAKYNLVPSCLACNADKGSLPVFEWWRPLECWTEEREEVLLSWIHANSFVSAHTDLSDWEAWCEATQRALPIHETKKEGACGPFLSMWQAA
ncbi:HNHc domain containing protein [uncultured Caudovirales phage]|uniref:HNHc domain containing protein n=1 Tax=uncultured Caudovirales phage TaxID=2100421 RepID=A0A6J7WZB6_9CAUD|nr:HNHc domain containing protein [uncultured Caudovirales phage]